MTKPNPLQRLARFLRRHFQCRFGTHCSMEYDSGMPNDIGRAGTCLDCGYEAKEIKWPRMPEVKPTSDTKPTPPPPPEPPPCRVQCGTCGYTAPEPEYRDKHYICWSSIILALVLSLIPIGMIVVLAFKIKGSY